MYLKYFGLSEKPFNVTPDPAFLYLGLQYEEALSAIVDAIHERKGLIGLVGEAGSGKTTLINALLERLNNKTKTAFLFNFSTEISFDKLLKSALVDLGVAKSEESFSKVEAIQRLHSFAIQQLVSGGNVLLIVDEAQNLSPKVMENLRLLSNLETRKHKLVQILLSGQSGLRRFLETPGLENVNERIGKWFHLSPMAKYELEYYIRHRLTVAGDQGQVNFDSRAMDIIYQASKGNPRRVNTICDRALLIAWCKGEYLVGKQTIVDALEDINGSVRKQHVQELRLTPMIASVTAALLIGLAVGGFAQRDLGGQFSQLLSTVEKVAWFQSRAFISGTPEFEIDPATKLDESFREPHKPVSSDKPTTDNDNYKAPLFDQQASLVKLFRLFKLEDPRKERSGEDIYPGLFSLETTSAELYRVMNQPFRIRVRQNGEVQAKYLLVTEVTSNGVLALSKSGDMKPVPHDFIVSHWDGEVSWVYPYEAGNKQLSEGSSGGQVLKLQKMLRDAGYKVETSGVFDTVTREAIVTFQQRLGIKVDGIVGTRTKALLYQVAG